MVQTADGPAAAQPRQPHRQHDALRSDGLADEYADPAWPADRNARRSLRRSRRKAERAECRLHDVSSGSSSSGLLESSELEAELQQLWGAWPAQAGSKARQRQVRRQQRHLAPFSFSRTGSEQEGWPDEAGR